MTFLFSRIDQGIKLTLSEDVERIRYGKQPDVPFRQEFSKESEVEGPRLWPGPTGQLHPLIPFSDVVCVKDPIWFDLGRQIGDKDAAYRASRNGTICSMSDPMQKRWNQKQDLQSATSDRDGDDSVDSKDPPPSCHPELPVQGLMNARLKDSGQQCTSSSGCLKDVGTLG